MATRFIVLKPCKSKGPVWVSVDHIMLLEDYEGSSCITLQGGEVVWADASPSEIADMISAASDPSRSLMVVDDGK